MKQFSEEENKLKCIKKNWWEIILKLDMKTHLFCLKHLAKKKYFLSANEKVRPVFVEMIQYVIC